MNIKNLVDEMFNDIIKDYENEKMIQYKGYVNKTTVRDFLGGLNNV